MGYPWPTYLPIFSGAQEASWDPSELTSLIDEWDAASGCVTDGACDFEVGSAQYLKNDSPTVQFDGGSAFAIRMTWKPESVGTNMKLIDRSASSNLQMLFYQMTSGKVRLYLSSNKTSWVANGEGDTVLSAGTAYDIVIVYDGSAAAADRVVIYVDGAPESLTISGTWPTSISAPTSVLGVSGVASERADGIMQCLGLSSSALSGAALTAAHTATFYADMGARQSDWFSFFNLCEASGARVDSAGSNDLSAVNAPGVAAGVAEGAAVNNSPVKQQTGVVNGTVRSQSDITKQPLWIANAGDPYLLTDGTDDWFTVTLSDASTSQTYAIRHEPDGAAGTEEILFDIETGRLVITHLAGSAGNLGIYDGTAWREPGAAAAGEQVLLFDLDGSASELSVYRDGVIVGSATAYTPRAIGGSTGFFAQFAGVSQNYSGKVYKDVLVASALTDDERASLDSYMGV